MEFNFLVKVKKLLLFEVAFYLGQQMFLFRNN